MASSPDVRALCRGAIAATGASACLVSRVLGDALVQIAEHVDDGGTLTTGQGYLASDFPLTMEVLQRREPRRVWAGDAGADQAEVALLGQLGYGALLMLPLVIDDEVWGLVEVYKRDDPFTDAEEAAARRLVEAAAARR